MIGSRQVIAGIVRLAVCGMLTAGWVATANAGVISTEDAARSEQVTKAREQVKALAERPELAAQLKALGVAPDQAAARVDAMTDAEVLTLAGKLGDLPAGGRLTDNELILILVIILVLALVL
jgi:uncharacterized protein DUF6627